VKVNFDLRQNKREIRQPPWHRRRQQFGGDARLRKDNAIMARLPSHLTAVTTRLDTSFLKPAHWSDDCDGAPYSQDERSAE
jgi:hypothetical protein